MDCPSNFLAALKAVCPVITDNLDKFLKDWRKRFSGQALAVVQPYTYEQIRALLAICQDYKVGIVPQGGNTSLAAGSIPTVLSVQVVLSFKHMNAILQINRLQKAITVQAGCTLKQVKEAAAKIGLFFPLTIAPEEICQVGGMIATNCAGINVQKYGLMRDLVLGLKVITPEGLILDQMTELRKTSRLDLKQIFVGSEGTLGLILEASLKLFVKPHSVNCLMMGFSDFDSCLGLLRQVEDFSGSVSLCEVIGPYLLRLYDRNKALLPDFYLQNNNSLDKLHQFLASKPEWVIVIETENYSPEEMNFRQAQLKAFIQQNSLSKNYLLTAEPGIREDFLRFRKVLPYLEKAVPGFIIKHDIALPVAEMRDFIINNSKKLTELFEGEVIVFGHLADGSLHYNLHLQENKISEELENQVNETVYKDVINRGGYFAAEHGLGSLKRKWFQKYTDQNSYLMSARFKQLLDPQGIMNPGKIWL